MKKNDLQWILNKLDGSHAKNNNKEKHYTRINTFPLLLGIAIVTTTVLNKNMLHGVLTI